MRKFCLAVAAALLSAVAASAQSPSGILQVSGGCAGGCGVAAPSATVVAAPAAGASCGCDMTAAKPSIAHRLLNPLTIGQGCASTPGCSTPAMERTFLFGSCNQFFNPGNKCGTGKCGPGMLFGQGNLGNSNNCVYGSYLNR